MNKGNSFNVEKVFKEYSKIVKDFTQQQVEDLLAVVIADPEIFLRNDLGKQFDDTKLSFYRKKYQSLSMFEEKRYEATKHLLSKLNVWSEVAIDEKYIHFTGKDSELFSQYPKIEILVDVLERKNRKFETGEELPPELQIKVIELFSDDSNDYIVALNEKYNKTLEVSKIINVWEQFYILCENGYLSDSKEGQYLYDYFNFRFENKLYKWSGYPPQQLIEKSDKGKLFKPTFSTSINSTKALARRR